MFFDFWEVAIFHLGCHEEVEMSPELNEAGYETHTLMTLIHLLMLWKTKLDHRFGSYDVLK